MHITPVFATILSSLRMGDLCDNKDMNVKHYSQVFCRQFNTVGEEEMLFGVKKYGFGEGKLMIYGGKIENNETAEKAAIRELLEESGVQAHSLIKRGNLSFHMIESNTLMEMIIFECTEFSGQPKETREMAPEWLCTADLPYQRMWEDARLWIPLFLDTGCFTCRFTYTDNNTLYSYTLSK
mmetsp:Transcript_8323/g.8486  ORF Transcript_8323/g.8486 Transcript_8323/m.8486 type:complete len:181 (-) Transcript_8323:208-750(-)